MMVIHLVWLERLIKKNIFFKNKYIPQRSKNVLKRNVYYVIIDGLETLNLHYI